MRQKCAEGFRLIEMKAGSSHSSLSNGTVLRSLHYHATFRKQS